MKKVLMLLLGAMLVLSMAGISAGADNSVIEYDSESKSGTATVTLSLHSIYKVTLPGDIPLLYNDKDAFVGKSAFNVEILRLGTDEVLNITVTGKNTDTVGNKWRLHDSKTQNYIAYSLGVGTSEVHIGEQGNTDLTPTSNLLVPNTKISVKDKYLHALVPYSSVAGLQLSNEEYVDTLTFTVHVGPGSV